MTRSLDQDEMMQSAVYDRIAHDCRVDKSLQRRLETLELGGSTKFDLIK